MATKDKLALGNNRSYLQWQVGVKTKNSANNERVITHPEELYTYLYGDWTEDNGDTVSENQGPQMIADVTITMLNRVGIAKNDRLVDMNTGFVCDVYGVSYGYNSTTVVGKRYFNPKPN